MDPDTPFSSYLAQMDNIAAAATLDQSFPTTTTTNLNTLPSSQLLVHPSSANLPDCFLTLRCDNCEILFHEAGTEPRFTFPCGHVYCLQCMTRASTLARTRDVHVLCNRCGNLIVRKMRNAPPCTHQIPAVAFDVREPPDRFVTERFPDRFRLALGQKTGPKCQRCWLVTRLQHLTCQIGKSGMGMGMGMGVRFDLRPFTGEVFACVEVDSAREVVHGMVRESPEAEVDLEDDVELRMGAAAGPGIVGTQHQQQQELVRIASDLCGGLGQIPMESNFDPRGHIVVKYRLRGWGKWVRENGIEEKNLPVPLRAAVYGEWL